MCFPILHFKMKQFSHEQYINLRFAKLAYLVPGYIS